MKTSRQRLLDYIEIHQFVSAIEISLAMHMTAANARYHLSILEEQGLVEVIGLRAPRAKGRPTQIFGLSKGKKGQNLDNLADALLWETLDGLSKPEREEFLRRIAARMYERAITDSGYRISRNLTIRLNEAVRILNAQNFMARWEAHAEAPRLILANCPYAAILADHSELCQLDAQVIEKLLASPIRQVARLEFDAQGSPHCIFKVGKL
jgi:predicted ArsR family transcriptional regulator